MTIISCCRRLHWCAAHRVLGHESKCGHLHGHNYVGYFHARPMKGLDQVGRVVDFFVLKDKIWGWIERHWDHGLILSSQDIDLIQIMSEFKASNGEIQKTYLMEKNPTAENIADHLLRDICPSLFNEFEIEVFKVVIHETENAIAEASF